MPKPTKPARTAKAERSHFFCSACGNEEARWFGRCPSCGAWNTAAEAPAAGAGGSAPAGRGARARWAPKAGTPGYLPGAVSGPQPLARVEVSATHRWPSGLRELDRVLGGGVMPGSVVLVGGDPGIGKSTLLLQLGGDARRGRPHGALRLGRGERGAGAAARRPARARSPSRC